MLIAFVKPLLAGGLTELLFGLIALIFLILRQLFEANKQAGSQRGRVAGAPQQPIAKNAAQGGQQADPLRNQVEEFLRRAAEPAQAGQAAPQQRPSQQQRPSEIEVLVDDRSRGKARRPLSEPMRPLDSRTAMASPYGPAQQPAGGSGKPRTARRSGSSKRRQSVAEHVAENVTARSRTLADQASQLGQRIVAEDQQFDVQLKAKFDHAVGTLAGSEDPMVSEQTPPASESPAARIALSLTNPAGVQQAVLLNEVLRRPIDRW